MNERSVKNRTLLFKCQVFLKNNQCFSACPETSVACPETSVACPETSVACPETSVACPETSVACPETSVACPETSVTCPETSVACPETSVACPGNRELNDKYHSPRIYSWVEHPEPHTPHPEPDFTCNFYSVCDNDRSVYSSDFRFQISFPFIPLSLSLQIKIYGRGVCDPG
jgi:hypothetical protein